MSMTIVMVQVLLARVLKCAKNRSVAVEPKYDPPHAIVTTGRPLDPAVQAAIHDGDMNHPASLLFHPSLLSFLLSLSLSLSLSRFIRVCVRTVFVLSLCLFVYLSLSEKIGMHMQTTNRKHGEGINPRTDACYVSCNSMCVMEFIMTW